MARNEHREHPLFMILDHGAPMFSHTVDNLIREIHRFMSPHGMLDLFDWHSPPPLDELEVLLRDQLSDCQTQLDARIASLRARRDELVARIHQAFANVSLGKGISISQACAIDDYADEKTARSARHRDREGHWSEVNVIEKDRCGAALTFMDAEGFRFYLPAYLVEELKYGYRLLSEVNDSNSLGLVVWKLNSELAKSKGCFDILSEEQRRCVADFLLFDYEMSDEFGGEDSLAALKKYWIRYLPSDMQEALK